RRPGPPSNLGRFPLVIMTVPIPVLPTFDKAQAQSGPAAEGAVRPVVPRRQIGPARAEEGTGAGQALAGEHIRRDTQAARGNSRRTVAPPPPSQQDPLPYPDRLQPGQAANLDRNPKAEAAAVERLKESP